MQANKVERKDGDAGGKDKKNFFIQFSCTRSTNRESASAMYESPFRGFPALYTSIEDGDVRKPCGTKSYRGIITLAAVFAGQNDLLRQ